MATRYLIDRQLTLLADGQDAGALPCVSIVAESEFDDAPFVAPLYKNAMKSLISTENTYLDACPDCFIGSVAMPDRTDPANDPYRFAFFLDRKRLLLLDNGPLCADALATIASSRPLHEVTTVYCLFELMRLLTKGDQKYLSDYEDAMERTEEAILGEELSDTSQVMLAYRRTLLKLDTYYRQLTDMADDAIDNENGLLTEGEVRLFEQQQRACERLMDRVATLREYSVQLRELHQSQIEAQRNSTMQLFTIITVLFVPLTLMTGWFGMNFTHMPGLDEAWAYPAFVLAVAAIVVAEIVVFKRKGWL
ncbi:CorA family divalent cation transporter [Xiamenia xianingshaonis]|uniref:Magnesium transporter CorA n=1 Tax=Xiamenia xianingshaonis TaxID=2682776 RepID=A0A9E6MQ38_9ACTN|nr:CorA family divalent cation transporter [Xiamenia xianingshaonis]NHM14897.1 magnesium transporter CorA [Xiamenia xianingshaonis]QTU84060.1 magnesium transporter CorA [Xiamenia xianingshaonis]